jgi:hypothetical protein
MEEKSFGSDYLTLEKEEELNLKRRNVLKEELCLKDTIFIFIF